MDTGISLMLGGYPVMDKHTVQGGVEILLVTLWNRNRESSSCMHHWPDAEFTFFMIHLRCFIPS